MLSERTRISVAEYHALFANGDKPVAKRRNTPEEDLHRACFELIGLLLFRHGILRWMVHYPSGGKRPRGEAGKLKAMGTKKGVPDLMLPKRNGRWTGLAIELKSATGRVSTEQQEWLAALAEEGYLTCVARTLREFQETLNTYLQG